MQKTDTCRWFHRQSLPGKVSYFLILWSFLSKFAKFHLLHDSLPGLSAFLPPCAPTKCPQASSCLIPIFSLSFPHCPLPFRLLSSSPLGNFSICAVQQVLRSFDSGKILVLFFLFWGVLCVLVHKHLADRACSGSCKRLVPSGYAWKLSKVLT